MRFLTRVRLPPKVKLAVDISAVKQN